jgi:xylulokinase
MTEDLFIGIDIATENVRAVAIDSTGKSFAHATSPLTKVMPAADKRLTQDPKSWIAAVEDVLIQIGKSLSSTGKSAKALTISATSGTFVITNIDGEPIADAAMYNDGRSSSILGRAEKIIAEGNKSNTFYLANTPEFVIAYLSNLKVTQISSDTSHCLKIGVDLEKISYTTEALSKADSLNLKLPKLVLPGQRLANLSKDLADKFGLPQIPIFAGMTDGCTAQISAAGASGSVTSLGTTMVIKAAGNKNIKGSSFYSHLLPKGKYLAGGACNIGGISYKKFAADIDNWNQKATQFGPASMVCYPLPAVGERFPFLAANMIALQSSKPSNEIDEYRAILEAIAFTERYSYELLQQAGAQISDQIFTVGGGGKSDLLSQIRATIMNKPVVTMANSGSDIGAAMLAYASSICIDQDLAAGLNQIKMPQTKVFNPDSREKEALERNYQAFLQLTAEYKS